MDSNPCVLTVTAVFDVFVDSFFLVMESRTLALIHSIQICTERQTFGDYTERQTCGDRSAVKFCEFNLDVREA